MWRTVFLTLRDETVISPNPKFVAGLLDNLVFSQSDSLVAAASDLPPSEVTSDMMFLIGLLRTSFHGGDDMVNAFVHICQLIYRISCYVSLEINSSSWAFMLDSFGSLVEVFLGKDENKMAFIESFARIEAIMESLHSIRHLMIVPDKRDALLENIELVKFLLRIIAYSHAKLQNTLNSNGNHPYVREVGSIASYNNSFWEVQHVALTMTREAFSRIGPTFPADLWNLTLKVFRKVMDVLASKNMVREENIPARFYTSLLDCLHLVLLDPKASISEHVTGLIATLRMFLNYGLLKRGPVACPNDAQKKIESSSGSVVFTSVEPKSSSCGPYRPPHLRRNGRTLQPVEAQGCQQFSCHEFPLVDLVSSDSDYSDSDGSTKELDNVRSSKVRIAAILCIQDLCQTDPKSFIAQWTMILPTADVLCPRKYEATLLTCLLFDPYAKARLASVAALISMLDGSSSIIQQIAEYKESNKCGSFTALSTSVGQILMQLHTGILYLVERETHSRLLACVFKLLMLLISATPYSRMPEDLLLAVISSLRARIERGLSSQIEHSNLLAAAISCLTAAFSASPYSTQVAEMLQSEILPGFVTAQRNSSILLTLFQLSSQVVTLSISLEALQALRAVSHNYPNIMALCWEQVSNLVCGLLILTCSEAQMRLGDGQAGNSGGLMVEKVVAASIKVLDGCLRAISGFKGTEDLLDEKLFDTPFTSDCLRMKKISSAPSYGLQCPGFSRDGFEEHIAGNEQWCEAIEKHISLTFCHISSMVRAASATCFAGLTSSVFAGLPKGKQEFILTSSIEAAINDEAPSVRSAACRAIGVIACFPQISHSTETLHKLCLAIETSTRDPVVSVRIPASWALANISDSFRHCNADFSLNRCCIELRANSQLMTLLIRCALLLSKDGDKIKSNAVRALGNLSRVAGFNNSVGLNNKFLGLDERRMHTIPNDSWQDLCWLEEIVQAFLSCIATGNVKVQWNVCHALSNLFSNETLRLQHMDWAPSVFSILLLLLCDSSNFKIRIQAAAALAVPKSIVDYGTSFLDVLQGLERVILSVKSDESSAPCSKYRIILEKQLASTMLHVLSLCSTGVHPTVQEFLVRKASFLEEWFKLLCSSLGGASSQDDAEINFSEKQKREMVAMALRSLIEVYGSRNLGTLVTRFKKLIDVTA